MKEQIQNLINTLMQNSNDSKSRSNDLLRDIGLRGQDEMLTKVFDAFVVDLRNLLSSSETSEETSEVESLQNEISDYREALISCVGWTHRAAELEVSSGMKSAQLADAAKAEVVLYGEPDGLTEQEIVDIPEPDTEEDGNNRS